jgi:hypothetical protein
MIDGLFDVTVVFGDIGWPSEGATGRARCRDCGIRGGGRVGAGEGIRGYRRRSASVACTGRLAAVVALHLLITLLVGLRRRILVGIGGI